MGYKIFISDYTEDTTILLPVVPSELPEQSFGADISDFLTTKNGYYTIIGNKQASSVSAEHMLPKAGKKLSFTVSSVTGTELCKLLATATSRELPIRYCIAMPNGGYYINRLFAVESWSYKLDVKEDWIVSMSLKEWKSYAGWEEMKAKGLTPKLSTTSLVVEVGKTQTIRLNNAIGKVVWTTSNASVASVNDGTIKGRKAGKCNITATHRGKSYKCVVKVKL